MPTHSQIYFCLLNGKASLVEFLYSVSQWHIPPPHVGPSTAAAITPHPSFETELYTVVQAGLEPISCDLGWPLPCDTPSALPS